MFLEKETQEALNAAAVATVEYRRFHLRSQRYPEDGYDFYRAALLENERDQAVIEYVRCRRVNEGFDENSGVLFEINSRALDLAIESTERIISG